MAVISNNDIAQALYSSIKGKTGDDYAQSLKNATNFLYKKKLLSKSGAIMDALAKIIDKEEHRIAAKITSTEPLTEATRTHLASSLKERYKADKVVFNERIDPRLLGGLKVEVGDEVIDLSIANKLKKLQKHLSMNLA